MDSYPPAKGFGGDVKNEIQINTTSPNQKTRDLSEKESRNKLQKRGIMTKEKEEYVNKIIEKKQIVIPQAVLKESEYDIGQYLKNDVVNLLPPLKESLSRFPESFLKQLEKNEDFNITVVSRVTHYGKEGVYSKIPGSYNRVNKEIQITTRALFYDAGDFEEEFTHLMDHLLGSKGKLIEGTLSSGIGINDKVSALGLEINKLYENNIESYKPNNLGEYASRNAREYLAQATRYYLTFPDILQGVCPEVYNVINDKWMNEDFWKEVLP